MRTPKESCQLVHEAIRAIRKSMYKHQGKEARKSLIRNTCREFGVNETHIVNVMGSDYAFSANPVQAEQQLQLQL